MVKMAVYGWIYDVHPGRSRACVFNTAIWGQELREHRMRAVYERTPIKESKSRSMRVVGYHCARCKKIWTLEEIDNIHQERRRKHEQEKEDSEREYKARIKKLSDERLAELAAKPGKKR